MSVAASLTASLGLGAPPTGTPRPANAHSTQTTPFVRSAPSPLARWAGTRGAALTGASSSWRDPASRSRRLAPARATAGGPPGSGEDDPTPRFDGSDSDIEKARSQLMSSWTDAPSPISGQELWDLVK